MPRSLMDDSCMRLRWLVADDGYHWSTEYKLCRPGREEQPSWTRVAPQGPWLVPPVPVGAHFAARVYEPLRWNRNLHVEFAGLPLGNDRESLGVLAAFASRYGTLGWAQGAVRSWLADDDGRDAGVYMAEHLFGWGQAISSVGGLLELVQICKRKDTNVARRYVHWQDGLRGVKLVYRWPGTHEDAHVTISQAAPAVAYDKLRDWSASTSDIGRYIAPLEHYLYGEINRRLSEHTSSHVSEALGRRVRVESLLGAFYMMLAEQLSGIWQMNSCESCGKPFVPRCRTDQKTCSAACRQRLSRRRMQEREQQ